MEDQYALELERAKETGRRFLATKRRSSGELQKAMESKGYSNLIAQDIVCWAKEYRLIDDEEYAKSYTQQCAGRYGRNYISHTLTERGVEKWAVLAALEQLEQNEREVLSELFAATLKGDYSMKNLQKAARSMARKGFEFEDIQGCMDEFADLDSDERMTEFEV